MSCGKENSEIRILEEMAVEVTSLAGNVCIFRTRIC